MAVTHSLTNRNAFCTQVASSVGGTGHLVVIDSAGPTDLARLPMSATPFTFNAGNGTMTTNAITEQNAIATGNADRFEIRDAATGTAHVFGTIATSGGDLTMLEVSITSGEPVRVQSAITYSAAP